MQVGKILDKVRNAYKKMRVFIHLRDQLILKKANKRK